MSKPTTIAERAAAVAALAPNTHAEVAAACAAVLAAVAFADAEAEAADAACVAAPRHSGCWHDGSAGCINRCADCATALHYGRLVPAWRLRDTCDAARKRIGAAIAVLPWGRAPDGFFVTNRRLTWDGDRAVAIFRHRVEVASVDVTRHGYMSRVRIADPEMARADRETARAKAREAMAAYHAALDAVGQRLSADRDAFCRLAVAVETGEDVAVPEWLAFVAGQEGGRLGDAPAVGARGALRRAAKVNPTLAGIVPDLRALTCARVASLRANDHHIEPSAYTKHEAERAARDAASAAKMAGPGWRHRALATIRSAAPAP